MVDDKKAAVLAAFFMSDKSIAAVGADTIGWLLRCGGRKRKSRCERKAPLAGKRAGLRWRHKASTRTR
jgi:hypothetical protein